MPTKAAKSSRAPKAPVEITPAKPEAPFTPVVIGGATYKLCFRYNELAVAEQAFSEQGRKFRALFFVLLDVRRMSLVDLRTVFAAAAHHYHAELTFEDAENLVQVDSMFAIGTAFFDAIADTADARKAGS